ncbi:MAG TPA: hypothetical protein VF239_04000 [Vicinamibacterales bacterium]
MYDLDGEDDDSVDITPEFMKHEDPEVDATDATDAADDKDTSTEEKD